MKKFKKIMAVLVAAIMVVAMTVPAWAIEGALGGTNGTGTITISNPKVGETYTVYKLFDLASFNDTVTTDQPADHTTDAYSYVIDKNSGWFTFLTNFPSADKPYAVEHDSTTDITNALFEYEKNSVVINGTTCYVISPRSTFKNTASTSFDDPGPNTERSDNEGDGKGSDFYTATNAVVQSFARAALDYAKDHKTGTGAVTPAVNPWKATSNSSYTFMDGGSAKPFSLGYYLLGTTMGTLVALDTTNPNVTLREKNDEPKVEKFVKKASDTWVKNITANIGDTVTFKTVVTAQQGALNYTLHDIMEAGLAYGSISKVEFTKAGGDTYTLEATVPTSTPIEGGTALTAAHENYKVLSTKDDADCTFEIEFGKSFVGKLSDKYHALTIDDEDTITVEYTATLDTDAVLYDATNTEVEAKASIADISVANDRPYKVKGDMRNTNGAVLTYGDASYTIPDYATVTTYQFDIVKTKESASSTFDLLGGAKFSIYESLGTSTPADYATNTTKYKTYTIGGTTYYTTKNSLYFNDTDQYRYAGTTTDTGLTNLLESKKGSEMHVYGLKAGSYVVVEETAPNGYNKLSKPLVVTIVNGSEASTDLVSAENEGFVTVAFENNNASISNVTNITTAKDWNANTILNGEQGTYDSNASGQGGIQIINYTTTELPSTGGMGTTVLYIVGGMLVILAGAYLFFSRKRTA